jgi:hypothetical protein
MVFLILVATAALVYATIREGSLLGIYLGLAIFAAKVLLVFLVSLFIGDRP